MIFVINSCNCKMCNHLLFEFYHWFLHISKKYNFGKTKLEKLLNLANREAPKFEQPATQFNLNHYKKKMVERMSKSNNLDIYKQDVKEEIYVMRRNEVFVSACCMLFIVLNQEFRFSSNSKGNGRLDKIMNDVLERFEKNQFAYEISWYIRELEQKTKVKLA